MNLTEFKSLSDTLKTDAAFLAHPEVRRVYWQVVEPGKVFRHDLSWIIGTAELRDHANLLKPVAVVNTLYPKPYCMKCGVMEQRRNRTEAGDDCRNRLEAVPCVAPDPIPDSLPDAVEVMRAKVAERWDDEVIRYRACLAAKALGWYEASDKLEAMIVKASLRDRWMLFAAAAGALEV